MRVTTEVRPAPDCLLLFASALHPGMFLRSLGSVLAASTGYLDMNNQGCVSHGL